MSDTPVATIVAGVFGVIIACVTGTLGFLGGRGNADAAKWNALSSSFDTYRRHSDARILDLESRLAAAEQYIASVVHYLQRNGLDVPSRPPPAEVVFLVPPTQIKGTANGPV